MYKYKGYDFNTSWKKVYWKKKSKKYICKQYVCLDTETSWNHDELEPVCWIYQWAFTFCNSIRYGRTPEELIEVLKDMVDFYKLGEDRTIYIYIHNLPYDFSYLCLYLHDAFGDPDNLLASDNHKPFLIHYECGLEFRCSYKLSNDSLERWGHKLGIKHPKMVGAIDYQAIHHQWSKLTRDDWRYMWTDCIAMDESIKRQLLLYNDTIDTVPITSTGYPRREIFREYNSYNDKKHRKKNKERIKFKDTALDVESYLACYNNFSGGITHGNRFYRGITLKAKDGKSIRHRDFRSHYPTQQHKDMPMSKLVHFTDRVKFEDLAKYADTHWILCRVVLEDVRLRSKKITLPYLQTAHVLYHHTQGMRVLDDNGRICAFKGQSELWLEYNELKLVLEQYKYAYILIKETYAAMKGPLPAWMIDTLDARFKGKSDKSKAVKLAKDADAPPEDILQLELDLMKDKNGLNGIYGVSATNPVRVTVTLEGDTWKTIKPSEDDIEKKLEGYYKSYKHCMRYQWGVATTILARLQLLEVYKIIGAENFIYCDTDSMFYYSTPEIEKRLDEYNEACRVWAMERGAYITMEDGTVVNYNAFTDEGEDITQFRFLHSKCYAYTYIHEKKEVLKCVIAGVPAYDKESHTFRESELGSIDELKKGKVFTKCGGTKSMYLEAGQIYTTAAGDSTGGGCIITKTTKTLNDENWAEVEHAYLVRNED